MDYTYIEYDVKHSTNTFETINNVIKKVNTIDSEDINNEIDKHGYFFCKFLLSSSTRVYLIIPENFKKFDNNVTKNILNLSNKWDYNVIDGERRKNARGDEPKGWFEMFKPDKEINFYHLEIMKYGTVDTSTGRVINGVYVSYPCSCEYCSMDY